MNLSNRCFFFPNCSGQVDLFSKNKESMVFLDFETTGLEVGKNAIIEIGAVKINEDGLEETFQTFVTPHEVISDQITQITGITNDMIQDAPTLKETLIQFNTFLGDAKLVAHNIEFDMLWLMTGAIRHDIPFSETPVICTLEWAKKNNEGKCSLGALTRKYQISHQNAHRALADAIATKELFFVFENSYRNSRPEKSLGYFRKLCEGIVSKYENHVQA